MSMSDPISDMLMPGSLVGLIVGYATQRYGRPAAASRG